MHTKSSFLLQHNDFRNVDLCATSQVKLAFWSRFGVMASWSDHSLSNSVGNPLRGLAAGVALLLLVPVGLHVLTANETDFYRAHGMVPDSRTAVRLAQMALEAEHPGCAQSEDTAARLQGEVWTVDVRRDGGARPCRVELDRKDGRLLRVETR